MKQTTHQMMKMPIHQNLMIMENCRGWYDGGGEEEDTHKPGGHTGGGITSAKAWREENEKKEVLVNEITMMWRGKIKQVHESGINKMPDLTLKALIDEQKKAHRMEKPSSTPKQSEPMWRDSALVHQAMAHWVQYRLLSHKLPCSCSKWQRGASPELIRGPGSGKLIDRRDRHWETS